MNILKSILKLKIYKIVAIIILGYGVVFFFAPLINKILSPSLSWYNEYFFIMIFGLILLYLGKRLYSSKNSKITNKSLQEIPEILKELSRRYFSSTDLKNLKSNKGQFKFNEDVGGLFINIIACYLIVLFTLGIGTPWAFCKIQRWRAENTTIEGKKIKFIGEGSSLFGRFILWYFLTIITLGIYSVWMIAKLEKFKVENTIFID